MTTAQTLQWARVPRVKVVASVRRPEGVTAGMARISRDPTPIPTLVRQAQEHTDTARARNERIVYDYGHTSISEHYAPSLAIWDIPRSLSIELVAHRLASYTQLSYRYVPVDRVPVGYFLPREMRRGHLRRLVVDAVEQSHRVYQIIYEQAIAYLLQAQPGLKKLAAERRATEDARYVLPILQTTQVGMTANARTWGLVICRLLGHTLSEHRALGEALKQTLQPLAPSLFPDKYIQPATYPATALAALTALAATLRPSDLALAAPPLSRAGGVTLVAHDPAGQRALAALLLYRVGHLDVAARAALVDGISDADVTHLIIAAYSGLGAYDTVLREFETLSYTFEATMSEACYHQFVRHRMSTQVTQARHPGLGVEVPPLLVEAGCADQYSAAVAQLESAHATVAAHLGSERAGCLLANGHRVRALIHVNARELIELSRLRTDAHAQWDVRQKTQAMVALVAGVHPAIAAACGGRDAMKDGLVLQPDLA